MARAIEKDKPALRLTDKLKDKIAAEDAEIARIQADAATTETDARARRAVLQQALDLLEAQPQLEPLIAALEKVGIRLGE